MFLTINFSSKFTSRDCGLRPLLVCAKWMLFINIYFFVFHILEYSIYYIFWRYRKFLIPMPDFDGIALQIRFVPSEGKMIDFLRGIEWNNAEQDGMD